MSEVSKNIGHATAYAYAVQGGYQGTKEEFAALLASYAEVAEQAKESAEDSEAWAVGEREGVPVASDDPAYHNNSEYFAGQADGSAQTASGKATDSANSALVSEGYAKGTQGGSSVDSDSPYYHDNSKYYSQQASGSANAASDSAFSAGTNALKAEGFAVGEQNEVEVGSDSPYYHNNAKYYSEEAGDSATQAAASAATSAAMTGLAPQFDSTKAYAVGDHVLYSGTLYQFTSAHAAGAWTGTDAVAVTLAPEVSELKSQIDALGLSVVDGAINITYTV